MSERRAVPLIGHLATQKKIFSWIVGAGIDDQQVGNAWTAADKLVSLFMNGATYVFVWNLVNPGPKTAIQIPNVLSTGVDASLRTWKFSL